MKENIIADQKFKWEPKAFLKQAIILFLIGGVGTTLVFGKFMGVHDLASFIRNSCFQGFMWMILWMGNGTLTNYIDSKISWLEHPERRFILGILGTIVYTIGSLVIFIILWMNLVLDVPMSRVTSILRVDFFAVSLLITAAISMFMHSKAFLKEWRSSASEAERLRNENLSARYETLKNQVNPHFLFNSFNVLSTLVYKDPDVAAKFIKQMSNLYRYVLETKDKETVIIAEEVEALKAFTFLSKMRFGDNLHFNIDLEKVKDYQIAPMTLQMLVENAIKHNVVSQAKPLTVDVVCENSEIIVRNNLQRKNNVTASAGIGLPNIQARYEYLSDEVVRVIESSDEFSVRIPLLKL